MRLLRGLSALKHQNTNSVVAIGNFDGAHLGHQEVLVQLKKLSQARQAASTVVLFEPQPLEYFKSDIAPARLLTLREKWEHLQALGIEQVLILPFHDALAAYPAKAFVERILVSGLNARAVVVGDDFHFGAQREGTVDLLRELGKIHQFTVHCAQTRHHKGRRISSSWVREALQAGDLTLAQSLLGYPYTLSGRVQIGHRRGRQWGFPTANIHLKRVQVPLLGVYAVSIQGLSDEPLFGVANIGMRPTVGGTRVLLEVHIFDFDETIYGRHVRVTCCKKIRNEEHFPSFDLLKEQIHRDAMAARAYFLQGKNAILAL